MKIVIEISERDWKEIQELTEDEKDFHQRVISEGTILPRNHGRLIDADVLDEVKEMVTTDTGDYKYAVLMDNIRLIPTIIEAEGNTDNE